MKIYWFKAQAPRRVLALAKHLGIAVDYEKAKLQSPDYAALNPNGKAPTLVDGDVVLWESSAIMAYLCIKAGSDLWPAQNPAEQVEVLRWLSWGDCHWSPAVSPFYFEHVIKSTFKLGPPDRELLRDKVADLRRFATVLDGHLAGRDFVALGRLTIADFQLASMAHYWRESEMPLQDFPHIQRWLEGLNRVPGLGRSLAGMSVDATHRAVEAVWRIESAKLIGALARRLGDVGLAEELAQDALVAALEQWPAEGIPDNPAAWLMSAARYRAIDRLRRQQTLRQKHEQIGHELLAEELTMPDFDSALDDDIGDDLLRLMFTACHPLLSTEARLALTLRLLGGLTTGEIARAFLQSEATVAQRIVRAKRTLQEACVPFEVPRGAALGERLGSVLEVIYLIFNEGYTATSGEDWLRPALCEEALRLGRILAELATGEPEVHGLVALMEIQASRAAARVSADGTPVLLLEQNRSRWDQLLIRRGLAALTRAERHGDALGPYALQAAIAACHARARQAEDTDWPRIAALYEALHQLHPTAVVQLNRAVAVAMAYGPAEGLMLVEALRDEPALAHYHLLPSVRGDLLEKLGRHDDAAAEFRRAAGLTHNRREQALLLQRAARCGAGEAPRRH